MLSSIQYVRLLYTLDRARRWIIICRVVQTMTLLVTKCGLTGLLFGFCLAGGLL